MILEVDISFLQTCLY